MSCRTSAEQQFEPKKSTSGLRLPLAVKDFKKYLKKIPIPTPYFSIERIK